MRERDVRNAIAAALEATDAFDGVFLWGFPDASDESAEYSRAVAIIPRGGAEEDFTDGPPSGLIAETGVCKLVILVRDNDRQVRSEEADRLLAVCKNALNGRALNDVLGEPVVYPQWTKVVRWDWKDPVPPQQEIDVTFQFKIDAPNWTGFDTSE